MSANITIEDNKLYGEMPDGSKVLLYDGKSWRLDDVGRQMVMQMGAQMGAAPQRPVGGCRLCHQNRKE